MSQVRFGLIGYGAWGSYHARAIAAVPAAELVAVAANSGTSCARVQADYPQARVYADYRELLAHEDLDIVDVVLPSDLHISVGRDVLAAGRHLLLEKPMALSVADCSSLVALAQERDRLLAVGHELRMSSLWGRVKHLIDDGAIGEPLYALVELWRRPYRPGSAGWRYDLRRVGDWILEEPIHFFDLARWYFSSVGEPISVMASANGKRPDQPGLHDNFSAILKFPRGRYAVITQTLAAWEHHQVAKVTGTGGALWASWSGALDRTLEPTFKLQLLRGEQLSEVPIDKPSGEVYELVAQITRVSQAVQEGTEVPCTGDDGRWSVAMCLQARASLASGRPEPLPGGGA